MSGLRRKDDPGVSYVKKKKLSCDDDIAMARSINILYLFALIARYRYYISAVYCKSVYIEIF